MRGKGRKKTGKASGQQAVEALFALGAQQLDAKDFHGAADCFRQVLRIAPDLAEAHCNLGVALEKAARLEEAETSYLRALALDPEGLQAHLNLGALLVNQKRFEAAGRVYEQAQARFPGSPALWSNRGVLHACRNLVPEAERCFRTALVLDQGYIKARFNLSYLLLREGRFEEGWPALEARPWSLELTARTPAPRWQGESLVGKSLLIGTEGGFGDMLQFCRYAALLKDLGAARIGLVCHPALVRLLSTLPGLDGVVAMGAAVPPGWDLWTLPLSLPHLCGTRLDSIPAPIPYLRATPDQILAWRSRLPAPGLRVGLAWQGNPHMENDGDRSLPNLSLLAPLGSVAGVRFVSLQKGLGEAEAAQPPPGLDLLDPSALIEDFADAAALVANLNLVISVDTAAAHLAGALGKPCWVLLPYHKTDWRWFQDRLDSPWYPGTMRLFRQPDAGGWGPVIAAVTLALNQFVQAYPTTRVPEAPQG